MTTTRPAATRDAATTRTETNDEDDDAIATTRDAAIETVRRVVVAHHHAWCQQFVFTRLTTTTTTTTATQAMTTLARARDDAVRRARESCAETRGDGMGDDAIARAKRAVTLGRRVSEKTTRRIDVDGGGETRRAALVRDRAKHLIVDARERVDACARAMEVRADERDDDED